MEPLQIQYLGDGVTKRTIACQSFLVHPSKHWHLHVRVVVNLDFFFILMDPVEAANILLQSSSPGNGHRKKKCVETGIIETFTEVASRRKNDTWFAGRNGSQGISQFPSLFCAHPAFQDEYVRTNSLQSFSQVVEMLRPARQHERGSPNRQDILEIPDD